MTGTFENAKNVYEAYAVFAKTTYPTKLANVTNSSAYPTNVVIKYTVTVKDIDLQLILRQMRLLLVLRFLTCGLHSKVCPLLIFIV